jgi:hypothetical protein
VGELPGTVGDLWLKGVVRADRQPIMSESSQGKSNSQSNITKEFISDNNFTNVYRYFHPSLLFSFLIAHNKTYIKTQFSETDRILQQMQCTDGVIILVYTVFKSKNEKALTLFQSAINDAKPNIMWKA